MAYRTHHYLRRLRNNSVILRDNVTGERTHFSVEQLRLFSGFDDGLRRQLFSGPGLLTPGGYEDFRRLWAQDAECPYQFAIYNPVSGNVTIAGLALHIDELAPITQAPPARNAPPPASTGLPVEGAINTPRRRAIVEELMWTHLERDLKGKEAYRQRKDKRDRPDSGVADPPPTKQRRRGDDVLPAGLVRPTRTGSAPLGIPGGSGGGQEDMEVDDTVGVTTRAKGKASAGTRSVKKKDAGKKKTSGAEESAPASGSGSREEEADENPKDGDTEELDELDEHILNFD
ncbi:hypothetical protein C2E23DRAFT_855786 [Lenzites betulinus]|nr:hypothetical protein C2E23DRAFT_860356 [Lenzites betulinus]KAH9859158.1 hypothetical protein C2E23DRAFT_855786 [Lenzites betulinus]